ncbi:alpha-xylosidase [Alicyclobacillus cellulosilyticus]|uniref:alpha-D-xyloside xylohydrolase n=1 Tax=Alicyclobacillus cellulosilyticus TaxID=1003997 RepID=A0A917KH34_9BACL|nr:alpha-xylosidase [Alicyclobacillus cellulosilyticus]GGJ11131.1 alpha-xylosidase [Alicyclobacillus cellulosilyticus]
MKFSDGNWLFQPGVHPHFPAEVYDYRVEDHALTLYAPCKPIYGRGSTIDGPVLTIRLSAPAPDIVRVQVVHFKGRVPRRPEFPLCIEEMPVQVAEDADELRLLHGKMSVRIRKRPFAMDVYYGERRLTGTGRKGMAYIRTDDGRTYVREQLGLGVGENVYGLGERFTAFVKNGQTVDIWNRDGGTSTEQAYKNVPFYVTNRGYGVFVNHPELVSFEVASEVVSRVQFSVAGEALDYFVIGGEDLKDVLTRYTDLTGKPALPPAWSFGLWLTTSFTTDYDEQTVNHFVDGMQARGIPLRVFHFDCFWMKEFEWCNFEWDRRVFPDPEGMLRRLKEKGLKVCVWINPYIAQKSPLFDEAVAGGYLLRRANGDVWQWDLWQPGMGIVDFTNPEARRWFAGKLKALIDMGVDAFKTDFGERIPTDVVYHDGSDPERMHNYYTYLYNQVVFETLREHLGEGQAVVFARSATAGGQRFPVHWGGDCFATYESMAESLRGGLSLSLCGFGFWSHDIGGFEDSAPPDLYKRWVAFGLLSSHSRLHGNSSYRVPWLFEEEAVDVLRHFTRLKYRLMPYLWAKAVEAHTQGIPVLRPMVLEFMDDPGCDTLDRQYMLGDALLVAPVFREDGQVSFYLPDGVWTHLLSNETVTGGRWRTEQHGYFSLPLYVRPHTILTMGAEDGRPDYDYADGVAFHAFALADGSPATATVYDLSGRLAVTCRAVRQGDRVTVEVAGAGKPWSFVLRGVRKVRAVENGTWAEDEAGVRVTPAAPDAALVIHLGS